MRIFYPLTIRVSTKLSYISLFAVLFLIVSPETASANDTIYIGSISKQRIFDPNTQNEEFTLDGLAFPDTRSKLLNPANFGPEGIFPSSITITDLAVPLTPEVLADFDLFFIGYIVDGTFSSSELDNLYTWVKDGGSIIITSDWNSFDDVAERFGYPAQTQGNPVNKPVPDAINHPLFNGPFGNVSQFSALQIIGYYPNTTGANVLARDSLGNATILEIEVGTGRAVFLGDVCMIDDLTLSSGSAIDNANQNDILMANMFAYLGVPLQLLPTMSQWAMFLFGLVVITLGVVGVWNLKRHEVIA